MAEIYANPDVLEAVAHELSAIAGDLSQVQTGVTRICNGLPEGWQSDSSAPFLDDLHQRAGEIRKEADAANRYAAQLIKIAGEIRRLERELAEKQARA